MEIAPGLHVIDSYVDNRLLRVFAFISGEQAVLVDAGLPFTPEQAIFPYMDSIGLSCGSIRAVIVTHCDLDHFGGCGNLKRMISNLSVYAHPRDAVHLQNPQLHWQERFERPFRKAGLSVDVKRRAGFLVAAGEGLSDIKELDANVRLSEALAGCVSDPGLLSLLERIVVLHLPGHTDGHIGLYDEEAKTAIIADSVMGDGIRDQGGELLFPPSLSNAEDYLSSARRLMSLPIERLLGSHFPEMSGVQAARFLKRSTELIGEVAAQTERLLRQSGRPLSAKQLCDGLYSAFGLWQERWMFKGPELFLPVIEHLEKRETLVREDDAGTVRWSLNR